MRFKLALLVIVLSTLACTVNVTSLNSTPSPTSGTFPTPLVEITQPAPTPALDAQPVVSPAAISKIQMLDANDGWLITDTSILRTQDGGATWHDVTPPGASAFGFGTGSAFLDAKCGWIILSDANDPINSGKIYRTIDGGLHWTSNATPFGGSDLQFLDDNNGWAMLYAGVATGNMGIKFFQTTDGGVNWTQVFATDPNNANATGVLPFSGIKSGFTATSMQEAWVSGQTYATNVFYLYHTIDGGRTWSAVNYTLPFTGEGMYLTQPPIFFDPQTAVLPMMAGSEGSAEMFLVTHDNGATWTIGAPVAGSGHYSVPSLKDVFVWFGGELSVSHDSGQTWTKLTPNIDLSTNLLQLQFVDAQTGWALTGDSNSHTSLYKTTDGGQTWKVLVQ